MSDIEQKVVEIITQLQGLAEPAAQVTLNAIRYGAVIDLVTSVICLVIVGFAIKPITKLFKNCDNFDVEMTRLLSGIVLAFVSGIAGLWALFTILSTSTWLAIFSPEMALARQIINGLSK